MWKIQYHQFSMLFAEWIDKELQERGWSRREAAKRANLSPSIFDKVINGYSEPGIDFLKGISKIFDIPLIKVLYLAGVTNKNPDNAPSPEEAELIHLFSQLTDEDQEEIIRFVRLKIDMRQKHNPGSASLNISSSTVNPQ